MAQEAGTCHKFLSENENAKDSVYSRRLGWSQA
jgi:hypothetical protein